MRTEEFKKLVARVFSEESTLIEAKGMEYTKGNKDRLYNFKSISEEIDVSPLKVWYVYFKKHADAITSFVKFGKVKSNESIQSRFADARNYLLLGLALLEDLEDAKNKN